MTHRPDHDPPDRLATLLARFSLEARLFFSGALCGITDFNGEAGVGYLHVIRRGPVEVRHAPGRRLGALHVRAPSLLFYPRPLGHRFITDREDGADMVCASLAWPAAGINPIAAALPPLMAVPLADLPAAAPVIDLLFAEGFGRRCGRQVVLDRLFEVLLVHLLRKAMDERLVNAGLLAGLGHPRLAPLMVALHQDPARDWTLAAMAREAGLSRSVLAATFRAVVGITPGDYLANWRVTLAQDYLARGHAMKDIAGRVGYGSGEALSRAFKARTGSTAREFLAYTAA